MTVSGEVDQASENLSHEKFHQQWNYGLLADHLVNLADMLERVQGDERRDLTAQFHDCAGKLPSVFDKDFGALVLEAKATTAPDPELRRWLFFEAKIRATWCTQAGSAGGECIGRYQHLRRIEGKLRDA